MKNKIRMKKRTLSLVITGAIILLIIIGFLATFFFYDGCTSRNVLVYPSYITNDDNYTTFKATKSTPQFSFQYPSYYTVNYYNWPEVDESEV